MIVCCHFACCCTFVPYRIQHMNGYLCRALVSYLLYKERFALGCFMRCNATLTCTAQHSLLACASSVAHMLCRSVSAAETLCCLQLYPQDSLQGLMGKQQLDVIVQTARDSHKAAKSKVHFQNWSHLSARRSVDLHACVHHRKAAQTLQCLFFCAKLCIPRQRAQTYTDKQSKYSSDHSFVQSYVLPGSMHNDPMQTLLLIPQYEYAILVFHGLWIAHPP